MTITRRELRTHETADQADVYRQVGLQLLRLPQQAGMPPAPETAGIPQPVLPMPSHIIVPTTAMPHGLPQTYQTLPPSGYPGMMLQFQQQETSVPLHPAPHFPAASTTSPGSIRRSAASLYQGIPGQEGLAYYGTHYQPTPDSVTSVHTKLICRHLRGAAMEVHEVWNVRVPMSDHRGWVWDSHIVTSLLYLVTYKIK